MFLKRASEGFRLCRYRSRIVHTGRVRKPGKPTPRLFGHWAQPRREIKQLCPVGQHLTLESDDLKILVRFPLHCPNRLAMYPPCPGVQASGILQKNPHPLALPKKGLSFCRRMCGNRTADPRGSESERPNVLLQGGGLAYSMSSRLDRIENWAQRAAVAKFRIRVLALSCQVSEQHLRRYFKAKFGQQLHVWLMNERLLGAAELLRQGLEVKEVAETLGFKNADHFSRAFKIRYGTSPSFLSNADVRIQELGGK